MAGHKTKTTTGRYGVLAISRAPAIAGRGGFGQSNYQKYS